MEKRYLREIAVSEIGMGCMAFSHGYGQIPEHDYSVKAIQLAYEYGCDFFDTAEVYGDVLYYEGHNEQILADAVKGFRNKVVLATKLHIRDDEAASGENLYDIVRRHLDASLKRLDTDYVDIYYLHRLNEDVPVEAVAEVMGRLITDGLVRGWGLSQVSGETLAKADAVTPVCAVQNRYNMLERDCETDIFPYCVEHNIGVDAA
ncbi:MAG: aldo/keto reductase [Clostridium sp.]|nr:aldo/keto reductase [Clostridium sp.]